MGKYDMLAFISFYSSPTSTQYAYAAAAAANKATQIATRAQFIFLVPKYNKRI